MKENIVNEVYDIPNIEFFLDTIFNFECYDKADNIQMYSYKEPLVFEWDLVFISDEKFIDNKLKLSDIITQDGLKYFKVRHTNHVNRKTNIWVYNKNKELGVNN